jgi:hypothetical protein
VTPKGSLQHRLEIEASQSAKASPPMGNAFEEMILLIRRIHSFPPLTFTITFSTRRN